MELYRLKPVTVEILSQVAEIYRKLFVDGLTENQYE